MEDEEPGRRSFPAANILAMNEERKVLMRGTLSSEEAAGAQGSIEAVCVVSESVVLYKPGRTSFKHSRWSVSSVRAIGPGP
jgi:hypothetical protein